MHLRCCTACMSCWHLQCCPLCRAVLSPRTAHTDSAVQPLRAMETIVPKAPPPRRWAILMDVAGLQAVRAQLDGPRRKAAHTAACTALNQCADDSRELAVDMATEPWWKNFIASQRVADQMAAVGITSFSDKRILGFSCMSQTAPTAPTSAFFCLDVADRSIVEQLKQHSYRFRQIKEPSYFISIADVQ